MLQERIKNRVPKFKLPLADLGTDRGFRQCCLPELVLANGSSLTWENDITPLWQKLSSNTDTFEFKLLTCDGQETNYTITALPFPNEPFSFYAQIDWKDVLDSDGAGIYKIEIDYSIAGLPTQTIKWGQYKLLPFTTENALTTARLRGVFNDYHSIEDINFKGSNLQGTVRFNGIIGFRQRKKEIRNLTYSSRRVKSIVRENLNGHELRADPTTECITSKICDLYLLSSVDLFASDYNAHNHSYKDYMDRPVTIEETEELEYLDFNRLAGIKAPLIDAIQNQRTFYK